MNIDAKTAKEISASKRKNVTSSEPFKKIMASIENDITTAASNGNTSVALVRHILPTLANYALPKGCVPEDDAKFWFNFVEQELKDAGFQVCSTIVSGTFRICW